MVLMAVFRAGVHNGDPGLLKGPTEERLCLTTRFERRRPPVKGRELTQHGTPRDMSLLLRNTLQERNWDLKDLLQVDLVQRFPVFFRSV